MRQYQLKEQINDLKAEISMIEADKDAAIKAYGLNSTEDLEMLLVDMYTELQEFCEKLEEVSGDDDDYEDWMFDSPRYGHNKIVA